MSSNEPCSLQLTTRTHPLIDRSMHDTARHRSAFSPGQRATSARPPPPLLGGQTEQPSDERRKTRNTEPEEQKHREEDGYRDPLGSELREGTDRYNGSDCHYQGAEVQHVVAAHPSKPADAIGLSGVISWGVMLFIAAP
uniref:Uncharacterized protein n=1 Tax=Rhodococcoides fascians D188 TaxID=1051973 RepID=G8JZ15_RHOFA|nr:hypothetical protein pFi_150 [Rhodococcus fascians D188]